MKRRLLVVSFSVALSTLASAKSQFPATVTIMGQQLVLKNQQGDTRQGPLLLEYIPPDETFEDWDLMFAVRFVRGEHMDPEASAQATAANVLERRKTDPIAHATVLKNDGDHHSALVDFLVSSGTSADMLEHNLWRFFKANGGMVTYQIARRAYASRRTPAEMEQFIKGIRALRPQLLNELFRSDLPIPSD